MESKKRVQVIIILLIIVIILTLNTCTITEEEYVNEQAAEQMEKQVKEPVQRCGNKKFEWNYSWEGWRPDRGDIISPKFRLTNLEDRAGVFEIEFAFFDNEEYPFELYRGKNYELVKDELPWESASMFVKNISQYMEAKEKILITPEVEKKNSSKDYWAYADVTVPSYMKCTKEYELVKENGTVMMDKPVKKNVTKKVNIIIYLYHILTG